MVIFDLGGATAGLPSSVARRGGSALLDKPAVAPSVWWRSILGGAAAWAGNVLGDVILMAERSDREKNLEAILQSPSYRVAYNDNEFLRSPRLRAARMELEFLKPELTFQDENIQSTIVVFGSTRIVEPEEARRRLEQARARLAESPGDARLARLPRPSGCWPGVIIMRSPNASLRSSAHRRRAAARASSPSSPAAGRASWRPPIAGPSRRAPSRSA